MDKSISLVKNETVKTSSPYHGHHNSYHNRTHQPHYRLLLSNLSHKALWGRRNGHLPAVKPCSGTFLFPDSGRISDCHLQIRGRTDLGTSPCLLPPHACRLNHIPAPLPVLQRSYLWSGRFHRLQSSFGTPHRPHAAHSLLLHPFCCRSFLHQWIFLRQKKSRRPRRLTAIGTAGKSRLRLWHVRLRTKQRTTPHHKCSCTGAHRRGAYLHDSIHDIPLSYLCRRTQHLTCFPAAGQTLSDLQNLQEYPWNGTSLNRQPHCTEPSAKCRIRLHTCQAARLRL